MPFAYAALILALACTVSPSQVEANGFLLGAVRGYLGRTAAAGVARAAVRAPVARVANAPPSAARALSKAPAKAPLTAAPKPCQGVINKCDGVRREVIAQRLIRERFPSERIQSETYLRNREGSIALDPKTGMGRRIDYVNLSDGRVVRRFEITAQHVDKAPQLAKERRIFRYRADGSPRQSGDGIFVRDRETSQLAPVSPASHTEVMRLH
ncbi:hypothetical protein [uncultured Thiodictyon sp.]|uniref:hypothetical protein n=1 Tax=uncultured Thiodictyon sp. TaxID=1846217 RepID=UPI0025D86779|nr:hypothetical protein [uncultured Thiodictyon sp.]